MVSLMAFSRVIEMVFVSQKSTGIHFGTFMDGIVPIIKVVPVAMIRGIFEHTILKPDVGSLRRATSLRMLSLISSIPWQNPGPALRLQLSDMTKLAC